MGVKKFHGYMLKLPPNSGMDKLKKIRGKEKNLCHALEFIMFLYTLLS